MIALEGRPYVIWLKKRDGMPFTPAATGFSEEGDIALPAPVEDLLDRGFSHPDRHIPPQSDND